MKKPKIRTIEENEIEVTAKFLAESKRFGGMFRGDLEKLLTRQFYRQKELLIGAFDFGGNLVGAIASTGQGDTVSIDCISSAVSGGNELVKNLFTAEEKVCRHYGYARIFLWAPENQRMFLSTWGYNPRMLFTFSDRRAEVLAILSGLYPMWIDVSGERVNVLLGSDYLRGDIKEELDKLLVKIDYLYLKNL